MRRGKPASASARPPRAAVKRRPPDRTAAAPPAKRPAPQASREAGADRTGAERTGAERTGAERTGAERTGGAPAAAARRPRRPPDGAQTAWIYGRHAVLAAIANPRRRLRRLLALARQSADIAAATARAGVPRPAPETVEPKVLAGLLPPGAVHQGMAALAEPLPPIALETVIAGAAGEARSIIVVLDQADDPRNIGAVLRSAAAFGAAAVVVQDRHAPGATAAMAKAACGALETVPLVRVVNLARALRALKASGYRCLGLDQTATTALAEAMPGRRLALVLGSEADGLRHLVRQTCDGLARIPMAEAMDSLNVSVAAAIALYECRRSA